MSEDGPTVAEAIQYDLQTLHSGWMGLAFPRQDPDAHPVLGRWQPEAPSEWATYGPWWAIGAIFVAIGYPLALLGLLLRRATRNVDRLALKIGLLGSLLILVAGWGLLAVIARQRLPQNEFLAILAAVVIAIAAGIVAVIFRLLDGRLATVIVAYPAAFTAVFLPPITAGLVSTAFGAIVLPVSQDVAVYLLDNVLDVYGISQFLQETFELEGLAHLLMWLSLSFPVGWTTGVAVTLAQLMRPKTHE